MKARRLDKERGVWKGKGDWPGSVKGLFLPMRGRREEAAAVLMWAGIDERDGHTGKGSTMARSRHSFSLGAGGHRKGCVRRPVIGERGEG